MKLVSDEKHSDAATKQDIDDLGQKLVWPPVFTRDIRLQKMQELLKQEEKAMSDPKLTDTEKVLRVGEYKRQYNILDNERYEPVDHVKFGAVPVQPLPEETYDFSDTESSDGSFHTITGVDDDDTEWEEDTVPMPTDIQMENLLKPIKDYRKSKAKLMLQKLASDGSLKWDSEGNVFFKGRLIPGAKMDHLVTYFQTAHKKNPLAKPVGHTTFGHALRKADAMGDVKLGGREDDNIRAVFKGYTPAAPHRTLGGRIKKHPKPPKMNLQEYIERQTHDEKIVSELEV